MTRARELWQRIETIHAVTYFAPESRDAARGAGLRGFWMGYFGFRAAPLGAVSAGTVEAAFANFAPEMVRRSIPDAWSFAAPDELVCVRSQAASAAIRRLAPTTTPVAHSVEAALSAITAAATPTGRPLFAANRAVELADDDATARLWQLCTTLREHRGDGHVAALVASGIDGCEAHHLMIAERGMPAELLRDNRGWNETAWHEAGERMRTRGLVDDHVLTERGRRLRGDIEALTDELAGRPIDDALSTDEQAALLEALGPIAREIAASGEIPFPNPMGLTRLPDR